MDSDTAGAAIFKIAMLMPSALVALLEGIELITLLVLSGVTYGMKKVDISVLDKNVRSCDDIQHNSSC